MCCPLFAWKLSIEIGNLASRSVFGLRLEGEDDWEQACIDTERCWKMLKDAESLFQRVSFSLLLPVTHGPGLAHNGHEAQSADRLSSCWGFGWWGQQLRIGRKFSWQLDASGRCYELKHLESGRGLIQSCTKDHKITKTSCDRWDLKFLCANRIFAAMIVAAYFFSASKPTSNIECQRHIFLHSRRWPAHQCHLNRSQETWIVLLVASSAERIYVICWFLMFLTLVFECLWGIGVFQETWCVSSTLRRGLRAFASGFSFRPGGRFVSPRLQRVP